MKFEINASLTIDILMDAFTEMGNYNRKSVKDAQKAKDESKIQYLQKYEYAGQKIFWSLGDMLGCSQGNLVIIARAAQKWYERTNWEICMTEKTAQSLLSAATSKRFSS